MPWSPWGYAAAGRHWPVRPRLFRRRLSPQSRQHASPLAVLLLLCWSVLPAAATVFLPPTIEQLTDSSDAVILATVAAIESASGANGTLSTVVHLDVVARLRGEIDTPRLLLRENGGSGLGLYDRFDGAPQYQLDEPVLVFLARRADGSWRTHHLTLGKWRIVERGGEIYAARDFGNGIVVERPGEARIDALPLSEMIERIAPGIAEIPPIVAWNDRDPEDLSAFRLLGSSRYFEFDEGLPLQFLIDHRGATGLGVEATTAAIEDALAAWNAVPGTRIEMINAGPTGDLAAPCIGDSLIRFDDPGGDIPDPVDCHGVLALAGSCTSTFEKKLFNDRQFARARRGLLTFANGWEGCEIWTPCNFAEIATHEIGHILGFDHSSERDDESDPTRKAATMYFRAHFDGRCAALASDDQDGARFVYPEQIPPAILNPSPLPEGVLGFPFVVALAATGGTGGFRWSVDPDRGGFSGLVLEAGGTISGVPLATGHSFFLVQVTDSAGNSHTKVLELTVRAPLTPAATPSPSPTATPSPTITRTWTPSVTATRTPTATATASASRTPSSTRTWSPSPSATVTLSPSPSPSAEPSPTPTVAATASVTNTATPSPTETTTPTATATASGTSTATITATATGTMTATATLVPTASPSPSPSATTTVTATDTPSPTSIASPQPSPTATQTIAATNTPEASHSPTTAIAPATPSPTATPVACGGDCDADGRVTVNEILSLVSVALGGAPLELCTAGDLDGDRRVTVDEILRAVETALSGCA